MRAPIRLGLQIPSFDFPGVAPERLLDHLSSIAAAAEGAGFDSLFVMDHLHQIVVIGPREGRMLEGNIALAALAGPTSRLNLGLLVGGVTYRNPALLAKITTTLDVLSGGRAILGLGAAWNDEEHRAYGFEFPPLGERFERLEDAVRICRLMFTEEEPSFEGKHYRIENVLNNPRPIRGDIPIMIGGSGERKTLRLVAQYADACNLFGPAERIRHLVGVLDAHCEAVGRDPAEIAKTRLGTAAVGPTREAAEAKLDSLRERGLPEAYLSTLVVGTSADVAEQAAELLDAGLDGLIFNLPDASPETVAMLGEALSPVLSS
jgi:F420-dependent oxidoreductase-like protein